jgi:hypothetical protein
MRSKTLAIISLLVLGCGLASAQSFGFESAGGRLECNYEQLSHPNGYGSDVWQGVDNLTACGVPLPYSAFIVGVSGGLTKAGNPAGFALKGVAYADNIYDAFSPPYTGAQWFVVTNLKCSSKKFGWIGFASYAGLVFGANYGYLSCTIPGKDGAVASNRLTTGAYAKVHAKE